MNYKFIILSEFYREVKRLSKRYRSLNKVYKVCKVYKVRKVRGPLRGALFTAAGAAGFACKDYELTV